VKLKAKGRPGVVAVVVALVVAAFSVASRRIGVVEPRVTIERGANEPEAARVATRMRLQIVRRAMNGEVAMTADRLREAAALATAASLIAVSEREVAGAKNWNLLRRVAAHNLLPPGATFTEQSNALVTPHGSLILHFRSRPLGSLGIEVLSIGKDKTAEPALIVRVAGDLPRAGGLKVWMATALDRAQLPQPFAPESEVIAAGWQSTDLRASQ
jgi:hypothetical protein